MSHDAGVQLRRLIDLTVELPRPKPSASARRHPLGLDIGGRVTYAHPDGAVPLPNHPKALEDLQPLVDSVPPGVPAEMRIQAWSTLLGSPTLQTPLRPLTAERLIKLGVPVGDESMELYRQVGLAVVARPNPDVRNAYGPIAGTAVVTVRLSKSNRRSAEGVWVSAAWPSTTRALVHELEGFVEMGALAARRTKTAAVLIAPELSEEMRSGRGAQLQTIGRVFGYEIVLYDRSSAKFSDIRATLERGAPSLVVALGSRDSEVDQLRETYFRALPEGTYLALAPSLGDEAVQQLREHLAAVVGVSASMTALNPDQTITATTKPRFPFESAKECLHDKSDRAYVLDGETSLWWTRDTAGHGDVPFKTYRRRSGNLEHELDRGADGKPIPEKWKGEAGKIIPVTDLHSCGRPGRHLDAPDDA